VRLEHPADRTLDAGLADVRADLLHGQVLRALGRTSEAIRALEQAHRLDPRALFPLQEIALVHRGAGRDAEARAAYLELAALLRAKPYMNTTVAAVAAALGEREEAIRLLEQAVRYREPGLVHLPTAPCYDTLRGDPRFVAIQRQVTAGLALVRPGNPS
jgi:tetratricopeptide (TPR) repeat protein